MDGFVRLQGNDSLLGTTSWRAGSPVRRQSRNIGPHPVHTLSSKSLMAMTLLMVVRFMMRCWTEGGRT